ncbi:hypothetical protein XOC_2388 [Xanthomonas oryzae pv. oryzicola BLS256]|uniref:Uncharacterized protein n=1 Tax=Xanthomonas oryzae pv. oryzicola (strain BLS256) TaxID=383407 RepID=G7TFG4_XANOB|nr:hypothetical protein XOC_2388 [Xanthomonas oryzae pv. oryzicola BLS256]QEO97478.1 hypothetical protein XOCgx_2488 [Xanthomonas oryzae pv. oryzicola]
MGHGADIDSARLKLEEFCWGCVGRCRDWGVGELGCAQAPGLGDVGLGIGSKACISELVWPLLHP